MLKQSTRKQLEHQKCNKIIYTFNVRSLKHCWTFSLVLALHSRNKHLCCCARAIPSSLLTALSLSWKVIQLKVFKIQTVKCTKIILRNKLKFYSNSETNYYFKIRIVWEKNSIICMVSVCLFLSKERTNPFTIIFTLSTLLPTRILMLPWLVE